MIIPQQILNRATSTRSTQIGLNPTRLDPTRLNQPSSRRGFTLLELLVAIGIIGIMAGMVVYSVAGARQDALRSKTRVTIEKINAVILEKWESYRYRAVKMPIPAEYTRLQQTPSGPKAFVRPRDAAIVRTILVRDMMRMEMPDRMDDLLYTPRNGVFVSAIDGTTTLSLNDFGGRYPSREYNILRNNFNLRSVPEPYSLTPGSVPDTRVINTARVTWTEDNQAAECLYAIVAHASNGFGSALEGFHPSEIGDTDNDTYPEFLDGWGNPIGWIRWPAGFNSALNQGYKAASPDAFDPFRTDPNWSDSAVQKPWTLVPLIFSAGPDDDFGVATAEAAFYPLTTPASCFIDDKGRASTDNPAVGVIVNADAVTDNVSNHDLLLE